MKKIFILTIFLPSSALSITTSFRDDLRHKLKTKLCYGDLSTNDPRDLWAVGIYDSQIVGQVFKAKKKFSKELIERASLKIAEKRHKRGAAAGFCDDGKVWTIATPAPKNILENGEYLRISTHELRESCKSFRVDFAPDGLSLPKKLASSINNEATQISINKKFLKKGVISLSCDPKDDDLGHQTWFMIPNKKPEFDLPNEKFLKLANDSSTFISWLNSVRSIYSMKPLEKNSILQNVSKILVYPSVNHHRKLLQKAKKQLRESNINLIGENRFIGKDITEAARQFWMSPRHRSLLLNRHANQISLIKKTTKNGSLIIMTVANNNANKSK